MDPTVIIVLAGAAAIYFFFQVPVWCGADTREGKACRNGSRGLLFGCNQFRQHKMQVLKAAVIPRSARDLRCAYWASPNQRLASIGAVTAVARSEQDPGQADHGPAGRELTDAVWPRGHLAAAGR